MLKIFAPQGPGELSIPKMHDYTGMQLRINTRKASVDVRTHTDLGVSLPPLFDAGVCQRALRSEGAAHP